jgi:hypothetical protein
MSPVAFKNTGLPVVVIDKEQIVVGVVVDTVTAVAFDVAQFAVLLAAPMFTGVMPKLVLAVAASIADVPPFAIVSGVASERAPRELILDRVVPDEFTQFCKLAD